MSRSIRALVALAVGLAGFGLLSAPAVAADNSTLPVCGSCATSEVFANKDIGGVKFPKHILHNGSGTEVGTSSAELFVGGRGTAGSAAGGVLTVQGSASGTAIPVSLASVPSHAVTNAGTFAVQSNGFTSWAGGTLGAMATYGTSPGAVNVPGVNAFVTNTLAPGQAASASSSPVVLAKNSGTGSTVAGAAVGTAGTASTEVVTVQGIASMTPFLSNPGTAANWGIGATGAAVPANATYFGFNSGGNLTGASSSAPLPVRPGDGTRNAIVDPCEANLQSYATGVITSATTTRIVAPSASNKTYACMFFVKASAADNVGVYEGTGGTCGTGKAGVLGSTTTANGLVFGTAGDGLLLQAGGKVASMQTAGTNVDLCLETSTTGPVIYAIKYVQAP